MFLLQVFFCQSPACCSKHFAEMTTHRVSERLQISSDPDLMLHLFLQLQTTLLNALVTRRGMVWTENISNSLAHFSWNHTESLWSRLKICQQLLSGLKQRTGIRGSQMTNLNDFRDPLTFPPALPWIAMKFAAHIGAPLKIIWWRATIWSRFWFIQHSSFWSNSCKTNDIPISLSCALCLAN